jgi:uncharacterized protein
MRDARYWVERLRLAPHPEGGWYRETYRAAETIAKEHLPERFAGARAFSTAVYYLLERGQRSALHRIRADELWLFHAGDAVTVYVLDPAGALITHVVGDDPDRGEHLQMLVPAGHWFGAAVETPGRWALVGCTVAPGFDFADLELADRDTLLAAYPQHREVIERLT